MVAAYSGKIGERIFLSIIVGAVLVLLSGLSFLSYSRVTHTDIKSMFDSGIQEKRVAGAPLYWVQYEDCSSYCSKIGEPEVAWSDEREIIPLFLAIDILIVSLIPFYAMTYLHNKKKPHIK